MKKPPAGIPDTKPNIDEYPKEWYFLEPGTILDQYIIERPLAGGGFSSVYLARQRADQHQVAIKEYLPRRLAHRTWQNLVQPISEEARAAFQMGRKRFLEEARLLAGLKHHNIVEVRNFFQANATAYLVMTYEYGRILGDYLLKEKKGRVSERFMLMVFPALLDGVRLIHEHGLLHLDIKPQNILIRPGGDPLLFDFGAAQPYPLPETGRKRVGRVLSNGFSPAEQYMPDGNVGPWSDIYSVGATMRMCLDGVYPPAAPEREEKDTLVPAVKVYKRRYSQALLEAIDWAMSLEPAQRPQCVAELLDALSRAEPGKDLPMDDSL